MPAHRLQKTMRVQTFVNGEKRQDADTKDLIFSVPFLIKTLSEGITITPGDIIASGTVSTDFPPLDQVHKMGHALVGALSSPTNSLLVLALARSHQYG